MRMGPWYLQEGVRDSSVAGTETLLRDRQGLGLDLVKRTLFF
jgi:hypothetical protein